MKVFRIGLVSIALLVVGLKLFTYEYSYADGPTSGVALRAMPRLESSRRIGEHDPDIEDPILIADENSFVGEEVYHFIVRGGWLGLPAVAAAVLLVTRRRAARR